jgi:hypothetical protein
MSHNGISYELQHLYTYVHREGVNELGIKTPIHCTVLLSSTKTNICTEIYLLTSYEDMYICKRRLKRIEKKIHTCSYFVYVHRIYVCTAYLLCQSSQISQPLSLFRLIFQKHMLKLLTSKCSHVMYYSTACTLTLEAYRVGRVHTQSFKRFNIYISNQQLEEGFT